MSNPYDQSEAGDTASLAPTNERRPFFEIGLDVLRKYKGVNVRGSADAEVRLSEAAVASLETGAAKVHFIFSDQAESPRIQLDDFRGFLRLGFKGKGAEFQMGRCRQVFLNSLMYSDSRFVIGDDTSINSCDAVMADADITIGEDCMFSHNIILQPSDQHGIIELATQKIINLKRGIHIGKHVWLGKGASLCPGVSIGEGSIVGMGSVVSKDVPACSIAVGNPAKVVNSGVTWSRELDRIDPKTRGFLQGQKVGETVG